MVGAGGLRGGVGSSCSMETELQFGKMRELWGWMGVMFTHSGHVLHATEWYT